MGAHITYIQNTIKMEDKDWNPNDWQGRSKKQVETNETLAGISVIGLVVFVIGTLIYQLITSI